MSELGRALTSQLASLRLAGSTMIAAVFASLYLIGAARVLGPREFSDLAVCLSLSYVALLFVGPLNLTLIRFSAAYQLNNDDAQMRPLLLKTARLYAPWVGAAIIASIVFAAPIARALQVENAVLVPWSGVLVGLGLALGAVRAVALGRHEHRLYSGSVVVDAVVRILAGGALVFFYHTAAAALAGFLIGNAVALIVFGSLGLRRLPARGRQWKESGEVLRFMALALVFSAVVALMQNMDMIAAKVRLGRDGAGDYAVALAIARGFILLAAPFAAVALARPKPEADLGWARLIRTPVAAYSAICVIAVLVLFLAPSVVLSLLFGKSTATQTQLLPILSAAYATAGAFLVLAQGEIRTGRIAFLAPVGVTMLSAVLVLLLLPATPASVAWTVFATQAVAIGCVVGTPWLLSRTRKFEGSAKYWDDRYARGGFSGAGSVGKFAEFKSEVLNEFVRDHAIQSVIELGCGDGRQLSVANYPRYLGLDVSSEAVSLCRNRFRDDDSKTFLLLDDYSGQRADLALSLDVIYHLVEDDVYERHMRMLFDSSQRWVIVYASNRDDTDRAEAAHVRHRMFTRWVEANRPEWILRKTIPNRYPYTGDFRLGSFADFFIFERA